MRGPTKRQAERLTVLGQPGVIAIAAKSRWADLQRRGWVRWAWEHPETRAAAVAITPDGLRALAQAMEAGLVSDGTPDPDARRQLTERAQAPTAAQRARAERDDARRERDAARSELQRLRQRAGRAAHALEGLQ